MMDGSFATLEARDPSLGRMRSYHLEAGTDLFGAWLVDVVYGRIGASGRRVRYAVENKDEARKPVRRNLRRRATARKRIGVSYQFRELIDPNDWCPPSAARIDKRDSSIAVIRTLTGNPL
jgi:hypothetical protein